MNNPFAVVGRVFLAFLANVGRLSIFTGKALSAVVTPPFYWRLCLQQMMTIGYYSLPVVGMTALFTGAVLALQIYLGSARFGAESAVPNIVVVGLTRELGPVLAGLMLGGRVGAAIAAELGTMKVTEQLDALIPLQTNPFRYLVGIHQLGFNSTVYLKNTYDFMEPMDVTSGLVKAAVFGFLIALMGCYHGFNSKGGAQGVGRATTDAVVSSLILILIANYLVTTAFFSQ